MALGNTDTLILLSSVKRDTLRRWHHEGMDSKLATLYDEELGETVLSFSGKYSLGSDHLAFPNMHRRLSEPFPELTHSNLHFILKVNHATFTIEVVLQDSTNEDRVFRLNNNTENINLRPLVSLLPLQLINSPWTLYSLDLNQMVDVAYETKYVKLKLIQLSTECKIRKVFMTKTNRFTLRMLFNPKPPASPKQYAVNKYRMNRAAGFRIASQNKRDVESADKTIQSKRGEYVPVKNILEKMKPEYKQESSKTQSIPRDKSKSEQYREKSTTRDKFKTETNKEVFNKVKSISKHKIKPEINKENQNYKKLESKDKSKSELHKIILDMSLSKNKIKPGLNKDILNEIKSKVIINGSKPVLKATSKSEMNKEIKVSKNQFKPETSKVLLHEGKSKSVNQDLKNVREPQTKSVTFHAGSSENTEKETLTVEKEKIDKIGLRKGESKDKDLNATTRDLEKTQEINPSRNKMDSKSKNNMEKLNSNEKMVLSRGLTDDVHSKNIDVVNSMPLRPSTHMGVIEFQSRTQSNPILMKPEMKEKLPQAPRTENSNIEKLGKVATPSTTKPQRIQTISKTISKGSNGTPQRVTISANKINVMKSKTAANLISEAPNNPREATRKVTTTEPVQPRKEVRRPLTSNVNNFFKSLEKYDYI